MNVPVRAQEDVIGAGRHLQGRGVRRVLITIEETCTAYLLTEEGVWRAELPDSAGMRVGMAGALIAGFLAGRLGGETFEAALQLGAATASVTLSRLGHDYGTREEVEAVLPKINVGPIDLLATPGRRQMEGDLLV